MTTWFITGTDTGVGKTKIAVEFALHLQRQGKNVLPQKWVQTGCETDDDLAFHIQALRLNSSDIATLHTYMRPYAFTLPASAHLAAKQEGEIVDVQHILDSVTYLEKHCDDLVIEGLGGVHVPITESVTTLDILEKLKCRTLVVVVNKLGAINHALLTLEVLQKRNIPVEGFIMNTIEEGSALILEDNPNIIEKVSGFRCLGHVKKNGRLQLVTSIA